MVDTEPHGPWMLRMVESGRANLSVMVNVDDRLGFQIPVGARCGRTGRPLMLLIFIQIGALIGEKADLRFHG
jgi:hypothetical protein